jgi:hypothetical protein
LRRGLSRAVAALASVVVVEGTTPAAAWAEQGVPAAPRTSVTLVTGDRVELSGDEVRQTRRSTWPVSRSPATYTPNLARCR